MRVLLCLFVLTALVSCASYETREAAYHTGDMHTSMNSLDYEGEYVDETTGRKVVVEPMGRISVDGLVGSFHWDHNGTVIHSVVAGKERYLKVGEGYLEDVTYRSRENGRIYRKLP